MNAAGGNRAKNEPLKAERKARTGASGSRASIGGADGEEKRTFPGQSTMFLLDLQVLTGEHYLVPGGRIHERMTLSSMSKMTPRRAAPIVGHDMLEVDELW